MFYIHGYRHGGVGWIQRGDTDRWEGFREGGYRTGWGYRPRGIQAGGGDTGRGRGYRLGGYRPRRGGGVEVGINKHQQFKPNVFLVTKPMTETNYIAFFWLLRHQ